MEEKTQCGFHRGSLHVAIQSFRKHLLEIRHGYREKENLCPAHITKGRTHKKPPRGKPALKVLELTAEAGGEKGLDQGVCRAVRCANRGMLSPRL